MQKQYIFLILLLIFSVLLSQAQEHSPDFFPVSPQAASFGKYMDLPVDLSTGRINYQIPLYTVNEGEVTLPITLSYNYSGLMVDEKSTTTGLGWTMMAGGVITRKVNGKPDEQGYMNGSGQWVYDYYHGNLTPEQESTMIVQSGMGDMDTQPDEFRIMANGLSATFYINHNGEVVFFPDSNLIVEYKYSVGNFESFTVTDTSGNKYVFSEKDLVNNNTFTDDPIETIDFYTSSWYLKEIIPYTTKRPIEFEYRINSTALYSRSKRVDALSSFPSPFQQCNNRHHSPIITTSTTVFDDLVISQIKSPNQTIDFNYTSTDGLERGLVISDITSTNGIEYDFTMLGNQLIQQIVKKIRW